jgi:hypothetical protein
MASSCFQYKCQQALCSHYTAVTLCCTVNGSLSTLCNGLNETYSTAYVGKNL